MRLNPRLLFEYCGNQEKNYTIRDTNDKAHKVIGTITPTKIDTLEIRNNGGCIARMYCKTGHVECGDRGRSLRLVGTEFEEGWLEPGLTELYDPAFPHPELSHLTSDLQHVGKIQRGEFILA